MLTISPTTLAAFEEEQRRSRPAAFGRWWELHARVLGPLDRFTAAKVFDRYAAEGTVAEIDVMDDEIFVWVAARYRMPDMGDRQYLAVTDVIFADMPDEQKLAAVDHIARTVPSGQ